MAHMLVEDDMAEEQKVAVELAQLKEQMKSIGDNVSEIKSTMANLISLDKVINELAIYTKQTQENLRLLQDKYDGIGRWQQEQEYRLAETHRSIDETIAKNSQETQKELLAVDRKVEAWTNQAKGALGTAGIFLSIVQIVIFAAIAWAFTNLSDVRDMVREHEVKFEQMKGVSK